MSFANKFLVCAHCGGAVYREVLGEDDVYRLLPCGHAAEAVSLCPSWSPVDGCLCSDEELDSGSHGRSS